MNARSEFAFINDLRRRVGVTGNVEAVSNDLVAGIGDDAAIFRTGKRCETVVTTDLLVEEIDFRLSWITPAQLGHKALAVSLSDIAAMGARPRWSLVALGLPVNLWSGRFVSAFYRGYLALAERNRVVLIGGDTSRTPDRAVIDSIVIGVAEKGRAVQRAGACVGDAIYVTGSLGGAAAGLQLLQTSQHTKLARSNRHGRALIARQLRPTPRTNWGALLGAKRLASAMIDTSDGLSSDLHHLCAASGVGALIDEAALPLDLNLRVLGLSPKQNTSLALHGGEDFELLFTVNPKNARRLPRKMDDVPITRIGEITEESSGVKIFDGRRARALTARGYRHF